MINSVICLETYQTSKTMHCSKTWINLHRFLDFANSRSYLTGNLSRTKLRSGSTFIFLGKYIPGRPGESKILSFSMRIECNNDCCITCMCINVITVTSHRPYTQQQGLRSHMTCIFFGRTQESQECGQIEKNRTIQLIKCRWSSQD